MLNYILGFLLLIEIYIFFILKSAYSGSQLRIAFGIQLAVAIFTFISLIYTSGSLGHGLSQTTKPINILMGLFITFGVAKLVFISVAFFRRCSKNFYLYNFIIYKWNKCKLSF